ncbi:MAG: hypothetical protein CMG57_04855 [Candidatus Marinimicrobia bacterium]|nr:hypothetical protein [Candidatus Neomarinimicrobiota bacterium]
MRVISKHFKKLVSFFIYLFIISCEDVELDLPGNTQVLDPGEPKGSIAWNISEENNVGKLPENLQGTSTTIGTIEVDDINPDDEIKSVVIISQKINGNERSLFTILQDSSGVWKLVLLQSANIDYETLHSQNGASTKCDVSMVITDDSPSEETGSLTVSVEITNINENPTWDISNVYSGVADIGIPYQSVEIKWGDTDLTYNSTLILVNNPQWLSLNGNKLMGTPDSANPNLSFSLKLTDEGGLFITQEFNLNVRDNSAPTFTSSLENEWDELITDSWTIYFSDPNSFDVVTATVKWNSYELSFEQNSANSCEVSGTIPHDYAENYVEFDITLIDNRPDHPDTLKQTFSIFVKPNQEPYFTTSDYQDDWEEERQLSWIIYWADPNTVDYSTLEVVSTDLINELTFMPNPSGNYGTVSGYLPTSYVNQDITFSLTLNDNRNGYPLSTTQEFTITVDPNDSPTFSNTNNILESINHGCQYYYDVNWSDPDGDNVTLTYDNNVDWMNINNNGVLSGTPSENDIGSSGIISLTITDNRPNVPKDTTFIFTISVIENFAPEFTNSGSVDTTATVGEEYSFQFAINDDNSDALTFSVPIKPDWLSVNYLQYRLYGTPPDSTYIGANNVRVQAADCGATTSFDYSIEVSE